MSKKNRSTLFSTPEASHEPTIGSSFSLMVEGLAFPSIGIFFYELLSLLSGSQAPQETEHVARPG